MFVCFSYFATSFIRPVHNSSAHNLNVSPIGIKLFFLCELVKSESCKVGGLNKNKTKKQQNYLTNEWERQNPTKGGVAFSGFSGRFHPPLTRLSSKCHNFFSIWSLLSLEKYVWQKYSICLFSKKNFECVYFSPILLYFSKKLSPFLPKIAYINGKQTNYKKFFKWKVWMF